MATVDVNRPVTRGELARIVGMSWYDLSIALDIRRVRPAFHIGLRRVPCYSPDQVQDLCRELRG